MPKKEYIPREAAIKAVKKERDYTGKFSFEEGRAWTVGFHQGITFALSDIASMPAADVRPVVLCKDCRHRDPEDHKCDCGQLERAGCVFPVDDDYFCAHGEKREKR